MDKMPDWLIEFLEKMPVAIKPVVETLTPNAQVVLHEGQMSLFVHNERSIRGHGAIFLNWTPKPSLWYWIEINEKNPESFKPYDAKGLLAEIKFDAFPSTNDSIHLTPFCIASLLQSNLSRTFKQGFSHGNDTALTKTIFHVANCVPFFGSGSVVATQSEEGYSVDAINGRCQFIVQGWNITIDRTLQFKGLVEQMEENSGFGLTHVGRLERQDGSTFLGGEALAFLENLSYLLSFCSARWCGVMLAFGYGINDTSEMPVWVNWDIGRVDPWKEQQNWFPRTDEFALSRLAPGFLNKMADPMWTKPLRTATNWYLEAINPGTMDSGIVLTQVGLELLAWTHMVHTSKTFSKTKFDPLPAQDKITIILKECKIPIDIPQTYVSLTQYAASNNKVTGPEITVKLRNALVHGSNIEKYLGVGGDVRFETWDIGLCYLELTLLWLSQYQGQYMNRSNPVPSTTVYETVPWVFDLEQAE